MTKKKYGMVIDLHKCVGCTGCDLACKTENNTPDGINWADHFVETTGVFPEVSYQHVPTLCNHCENPPCVRVCPTKAMYIDEDTGIVRHNPDICIGCKSCVLADPYGVIHFNDRKPHVKWSASAELIKDCTSSGTEMQTKSNAPFPHYNPDRDANTNGVRPKGVVEKCDFCSHRVANGELPHCVVSCPADARIFGDLNDPESAPSKLLKEYKPEVLKADKGTQPKVFYIRKYNKNN